MAFGAIDRRSVRDGAAPLPEDAEALADSRAPRVPPAAPATPLALVFEHVSLAFDDHVVLHDVSFTIEDGELVTLIGPSGSGKSLILKLALGLFQPDAGTIVVYGQHVERLGEADLLGVRDGIGMLFQESALFDSLTVGENVGFKLEDRYHQAPEAVRARVGEILGVVGLEDYVDRMPAQLSGGQRRRVALARAMVDTPRLLLLDDPTGGLDPITSKAVMAEVIKVRDLHEATTIVVTHQLQDAFYIATHEGDPTHPLHRRRAERAARARFLVLRDGAVVFDGTAAALLKSDDPWIVRSLCGWFPPLSLNGTGS